MKRPSQLESIGQQLFRPIAVEALPAVAAGSSCGRATGDVFRGRDQILDA